MDEGHGACSFQVGDYADEVQRSIWHFREHRYEIGCFVVMPNHSHLTIRPFETIELEDELGSIKV